MSEIQNLLDADEDNVKNCKRLFNDFSPELSQSLDDCANFYSIFLRVLSRTFKDDIDQSIIESTGNNKDIHEHVSAKNRFWSRRARATLLLLTYRSFMWAVTDIYRIRITASMNHVRQQIESAFYMNLIYLEPHIAEEWFNVGTRIKGRKFFVKYKEKLRNFCDEQRLAETYNRISGSASHSRLSSVIYSMEIKSNVVENRYEDIYSIKMQEVNEDKPEQLILAVLSFLDDQIKLFDAILKALPEMNDPLLRETRLPTLKNKVYRLFRMLNEISYGGKRTNSINNVNKD